MTRPCAIRVYYQVTIVDHLFEGEGGGGVPLVATRLCGISFVDEIIMSIHGIGYIPLD